MATAGMLLGAGGTFLGLTGTAAVVAASVTAIVINTAIAYALGKILAPSFNDSRDVRAMQDTVKNNTMPRRVIYGQAVTGGPLLWYETTATDNNALGMVIALTTHPVEDVIGVWIDDEYITMYGEAETPFDYKNHNSANNNLNDDWQVVEGLYNKQTSGGTQIATIMKNTGWGYAKKEYVNDETKNWVLADQARAEYIATKVGIREDKWILSTSVKDSRDSQTGRYTQAGRKITNCAYMWAKFLYNIADSEDGWKSFPKLKFHVKGKRVYNPALDPNLVAYGADSSGAHDLNDPDTWEWSEDWTLCVLDYLLDPNFGLGIRASTDPNDIDDILFNEIDWAQVIESYQVSSAIVSKGLTSGQRGYGSAGTGPRYTINGVFEVDATPISIMESLLTSGAGKLIYSGGKYKIRAGYYKAPESESDIINENMIVGPMTFQTHTPRSDLFNKAGGTYINAQYDLEQNPDNDDNKPEFIDDEFPLVAPAQYETEDGEPLLREFDFPFTIRSWEAQRLAKIYLERVRRGITVSFKATLEVLKYSVGDTIYLQILDNDQYSNEIFYNKLGLDDEVQNQDTPKTTPYYKQFMIMDMNYNEDFTIDVVLIEEADTIYDWNNGDATEDTGDLGSDVPIIVPTWPILPPTFNVPSPYETITEVTNSTGISTLVYFITEDNASPNVEFLDRGFIKEYILQYGEITDPSEAAAEDRVANWIEAGRYYVSNRDLPVQGPINIPDAYIDDTTDYDFRVRGIADDNRRSAWTYYSDEVGDYSPSEPGAQVRYYILPTNGTAIKDGVGTLIIEAHKVDGSGDNPVTSGNVKLYEGSKEITVGQGYSTPSDGYTGYLDKDDISGSIVVELRDDTLPFTYDSVTLVDITDGETGGDATYGYIEPDGSLVWTGSKPDGFDPSDADRQLDVTFIRAGVEVARWAHVINLDTSGTLVDLEDGGAAEKFTFRPLFGYNNYTTRYWN
jgi:hypothetical protein